MSAIAKAGQEERRRMNISVEWTRSSSFRQVRRAGPEDPIRSNGCSSVHTNPTRRTTN